ncbi:MAG: 4Fe-4S dicluster domain-containing protein [Alphaproteobacteria bacterium]|jgi:molybdopterin-containing oxidoreductase family iron-sulfur binding subunit|nr:4Fe-4S dicluster domain-containing protein [Alphaproteobacteria bacterium]MDP6567955.1 4Fe-4S dicluster domain-containing protein [Alphaproteobacteria bacterium]MDP6812365.1 4Fe-4S dicluster domain-containing protein [Alphaproteobacteria bacterium]
MTTWAMVFDLKRCIGCNACVVACKMENALPEDVFFTRTFVIEVGAFPEVRRVYIPTLCNQCQDAPCETACPSGATESRADGIVMVDQDKCIGCSACAVACPYDNRSQLTQEALDGSYFGPGQQAAFELTRGERWQAGTVTKCDFCSRRVDAGQEPACVASCPTDARIFGDRDDPDSAPSRLIRQRNGRPPMPEKNTRPNVFYVD